jgi:ABC-type nitrate/sulfonate/bicarbonate transport system permease component
MRAGLRRSALPAGTLLALLALGELLVRSGAIEREYFSAPSEVFSSLVEQVQTGVFWERVGETLAAWAGGFGIAVAVGVPLGLALGSSRFAYDSTRALIDFLRPIPPIAVLPLMILVLGSGLTMKIVLAAIGALWPVLFQAIYAVQDVDPVARDTARAYGLGRVEVFVRVVLPSALPYIATGVRMAVAVALLVVIATELVAGTSGLGFEMNTLRNAGRVADVYALVLVSGLLGMAMTAAVRAAQRRALHWHASERRGFTA